MSSAVADRAPVQKMTSLTMAPKPRLNVLSAADKKRRQHYVWRHYLDGWATDGKLWCRRGGRVFNATTQNVAHERDFYRLREMSEYDLSIVKALIIDRLEEPLLRKLAEGWIPYFTDLFKLKSYYEATGRKSPKLEAVFDVAINNLEEDMHARLENRAQPLLAALRKGDVSIFDNEESIHYIWFIAAQYFRTPRLLKSVVRALKNIPAFNVEASFGLMRTIMSTNVGYALWARRSTLRSTFLSPEAGVTFITGDQPIINVRAFGLPPGEPPENLELYYPLLPDLAVVLDFDARARLSEHKTLTKNDVSAYNRMIVENSHEQIYGVHRNSVEHLWLGSSNAQTGDSLV